MNTRSNKYSYRAIQTACTLTVALAEKNNGSGVDFMSISEYARYCGVSYVTAKKSLSLSAEAGYLYCFHRKNGLRGRPTLCYTINLESLFKIVHVNTSPPPPIFQHLS